MSVADYNTDPDSNTSISGINIAEGCPPSGINNAIRQMMADVKSADDANVKISGAQAVAGAKTFSDTIIESNDTASMKRPNTTGALRMTGGTNTSDTGALLSLFGADNNNQAGYFRVYAVKDSNTATLLEGRQDGTLTWGGKGFVYDSGDQAIAGTKTFSSGVYSDGDFLASRNFAFGTWPGSTFAPGFASKDKDDITGSWLCFRYASTLSSARLYLRKPDDASTSATSLPYVEFAYGKNTAIYAWEPKADNAYYLGYSSSRWKQLYAGTTTISTSDERLKDNIEAVPDAVLDAWGDVDWSQFQFRDSIAEKGADKARLHNGLVAQRIDAAFKAHGQDASRYGLFCYDEWDATPEEKDEQGNVCEEAKPAGNIYSLRYEEALCMEAAYQRRRADRAEARITELERRLDEMEAVLASIGGQAE